MLNIRKETGGEAAELPATAPQIAARYPALQRHTYRGGVMRARQIRFAIAIVFAAAAWGQTTTGQSVSQVFHFTSAQSPVDFQEITNAVRIGERTQAFPDRGAKTLTVTGTPAQVAMATWIFSTMDQPAPANQATQEYRPAGSVNDVVRILYLTHPGTPSGFQEIVNAVRVIPEMPKVFPYLAQHSIVIRGTELEVAMTEWLFHQLDAPAGLQPVQNQAAHQYLNPGVTNPHISPDQVQVLFLSHKWTPEIMQEIVNAVRTIPELTMVFPCTATGAVSVRGVPATVGLATWLFNQLDQDPQASTPAPQEFHMPGGVDDVTQVLYLGSGTSTASLQTVVNASRATMRRPAYFSPALNALIMRGTAAQIASADLQIKQ
jgi:hypothetical protein